MSNLKFFADDTSILAAVKDVTVTAKRLNENLKKNKKLAFQWKINFNPDPNKQAQEVIFYRKLHTRHHPSIFFNNILVNQVITQKHLGMILDSKLRFKEQLQSILTKINKTTELLRKLQSILLRHSLLTI